MWFKLDDNFYDHPKVMQAGNAAVGLWVRCGTHSAAHLTEGNIPAPTAQAFGTRREIAALTDAGMWVECDAGFLIPDYLDYNPSREQVLAWRASARERQARRRRHSNGEYA